MSDHDALRAAICANPEDDVPRLVYADWLDEHGQGKRAAFIRAGVERHRCENADTAAAVVGRFLETCEHAPGSPVDWSALDPELDRFHKAVTGAGSGGKPTARSEDLPAVKGVKFGAVERGFHSLVTVSNPNALLADPEAIFRTAPVTGVQFSRLSAEQARRFAAAGLLARVRHLGFVGHVKPEAIRVIGDHPDAAGVRSLLLGIMDEEGERLRAVAAGTSWTGVTRLELSSYESDNETARAAAALLRRPQFRGLRHFEAPGTELGDAICRAIATAGLTELRHLDLAMSEVGESGAGAIASSKKLPNLRFFDLDLNDVGGAAAAALINTPNLPNLTALRLCPSGGLNTKELAKPSRAPTLRALSLNEGGLGPRALAALAACPAVRRLWFLELGGCVVNDAGITALTKKAGFEHLAILALREQGVTDRGVSALAACPALASLQHLDLDTRALGPAGAKALVQSPHLQGLKRLLAGGRGVTLLRQHFGKKVVP